MVNKKQLGQFFTINSDQILKGLERFVKGKEVIDPFAGGGDLISWAREHGAKKVKGYDIDKKYVNEKDVFYYDSIKKPLKYKFVLTNPPYLNVNKADKEIKERYFRKNGFEDLYQISLASIMDSEEGIIIVPINFLSARNSKAIKDIFFSKFKIIKMNYFKNQVFPDTTNNVIAFYYRKKESSSEKEFTIKTHIYPDDKEINIILKKNCSWNIHGDFLEKIKGQKNSLGVRRLVEEDIKIEMGGVGTPVAYNHINNRRSIEISENLHKLLESNIILLKAIDTGTEEGKLALEDIREYDVKCLISKESSRHMIYLIFKEKIPITEQKEIIDVFNKEINKMRDKYLSLFLTNYRDKDRKRISFDFAYKFINYIYFNEINNRSRKLI